MDGSIIAPRKHVIHKCKRSLSSLILSVLILCLFSGCSAHTINSNVHVGVCVKAL